MQFTLRFLLLAFPLIAVCLAIFDWPGLVIGLALTGSAVYASKTRTRTWDTLRVVLVLGVGILYLLPAVGDARRAARRVATARRVFPAGLSRVAIGLRNYHDRFGRLPPVQERDSLGQTRHSWRVLILEDLVRQGCDKPALASQYNRNEAWDGPNNRKLAAEHPRYATCLAVVGEDGEWLRPTADSNPVQAVEDCGPYVPWVEPRDLTVEEACQAIHVPMPSGRLVHRLLSETSPCVAALFADGEEIGIPVHTPPTILRAALLGDRATQRELASYRDLSRRLRWFDYLTLACLVACWVAMIRAGPHGRPIEPEGAKVPASQEASG